MVCGQNFSPENVDLLWEVVGGSGLVTGLISPYLVPDMVTERKRLGVGGKIPNRLPLPEGTFL